MSDRIGPMLSRVLKASDSFSVLSTEELIVILGAVSSELSSRPHSQIAVTDRKRSYTSCENELCPICSSALVERHGKSGPFVGCRGFPKCRFTAKLEPLANEVYDGS